MVNNQVMLNGNWGQIINIYLNWSFFIIRQNDINEKF